MKTEIVLCPTLRRAFYEWHRLVNAYPDMWTDVCRKPMSLTSIYGVKYIFRSENETDKLRGLHVDIISIDELPNAESEEDTK